MTSDSMKETSSIVQKKKSKKEFVFLLLSAVHEKGENIKGICEDFGRSRQNLAYHLKKMIRLRLIEKTQSYPYSIYSLTPLGSRIKDFDEQSDTKKPLWRCHNLIVGFDIKDFGTFDFSKHKISQMRGWHFASETIKDSLGHWKVHIQSTGLLKIYCPEIYSENSGHAFGNMEDIAVRISQKYAEIYQMDIGLMKRIREGHKELVNSELLAKVFGKTKVGGVWIDSSTGTEWLEEEQTSHSLEELLNLPARIGSLESHLIKQTEVMDNFTKQMELHLKVLGDIGTAITELKNTVKEMKK